MEINKLDLSMPIFALLSTRPLPLNGIVHLNIISFMTRKRVTSEYIPKYYDADEELDNHDRGDIIQTVKWEMNVLLTRAYLLKFCNNDSLVVERHLFGLDNNGTDEYHVEKIDSFIVWPKSELIKGSKLDMSMEIFKLLENMERPYNGEVRLHVNTFTPLKI